MANKPVIVDVREPFEFAMGHVAGALNVPMSALMFGDLGQLAKLDRGSTLILYCRSGGRAERAKHILKSAGFNNVQNGINQSEIENDRCDG